MKVFSLECSDSEKFGMFELVCAYYLPRVDCKTCGNVSLGGNWDFPCFDLPWFNKGLRNLPRALSLSEFNALTERICAESGRRMNLTPGCGVGPLHGRAYIAGLEDCVWNLGTVPYLSRDALEALAGEGIRIPSTPFSVKFGRKLIDTYASLDLSPTFVLTEYSRGKLNRSVCKVCQSYTCNPYIPRLEIKPSWREVRKDLWPKGEHLVGVADDGEVVVSEEFMDAVKKLGLTGFEFREFGSLVEGERSGGPRPVPVRKLEPAPALEIGAVEQSKQPNASTAAELREMDRIRAREQAQQVAKLLGSSARVTDGLVIKERFYWYKVCLNTTEIVCSVEIGDGGFVFSTRAKRRRPVPDLYFVSIKRPATHMFAVKVNALLSEALGVEVYKMEPADEAVVHHQLTGGPSWNLLRALDFTRIEEMRLNPAQCTVVGVFDSPESCATLVKALRDFVSLAFKEALERRSAAQTP